MIPLHDYYRTLIQILFFSGKHCTSHPEIADRHLHGNLKNFWAATNRDKTTRLQDVAR